MSAGIQIVPRELLAALAAEAPAPAPALVPPPSANGTQASNGQYTSRLLVARWLTDRNVGFRVKEHPDGKGRTVYVLKQCPFNPDHGDPDSCIMQAPDGKLSAQCFHNSCGGHGWQAFKQALGPPGREHYDPPLRPQARRRHPGATGQSAPGATPNVADCSVPPSNRNDEASTPGGSDATAKPGGAGLPWIQGNKRQLRDVTADALAALLARNEPPTIFQRGEVLTRLRFREKSHAPLLEPLNDAALRGVLTRVANWKKVRDTKQGPVEEEEAPPLEVVKDLANLPGWDGLPYLDAVVEAPVFAAAGELILDPGYHATARLWYHPAQGLIVPPVPTSPNQAEIETARNWLLVELMGDFPFQDEASKAHALAALVLPFVRPMIDGPTPLHLFEAPVEGTGKTLLASVIAVVATGRDAEAIAEANNDEEWRKRITAVLAEGPAFVLLDNLSRTLDTGALASVLTCRVWKDRLLGISKTASLPNTPVWLASGNNVRLSRELIRRTLWSRLDARVDAPWERTEFRHPHLLSWTKGNRGQLVWAVLTLVRAWILAGRPAGSQTLGMFESWAETIGGILQVAGVDGLLANAREFRSTHADQLAEWRAFVTAWSGQYGEQIVGIEELYGLATREKLLDSVLGDKGERSQRTKLGLALAKAVDRIIGDYRIERGAEDHKGRQQYQLRPAKTKAEEVCK